MYLIWEMKALTFACLVHVCPQVATQRLGVPPHIIDTFPTYTYVPPKGPSPTHAAPPSPVLPTATAETTAVATANAAANVHNATNTAIIQAGTAAAVPLDGAGSTAAGGLLLGRSASMLLAAQGRTRSDRLALQAAAAEAATVAATAALMAAQTSEGLDSEGHSPPAAAAGALPGQQGEPAAAGVAAGTKTEAAGQQGVTAPQTSMERVGSRSMMHRRVAPPSDAAAQAATEAAHRAAAATLAAAVGGAGQAPGPPGRTSHEVSGYELQLFIPVCPVTAFVFSRHASYEMHCLIVALRAGSPNCRRRSVTKQ
jgi:hypothetical protein